MAHQPGNRCGSASGRAIPILRSREGSARPDQQAYVEDFHEAVLAFLGFHERYASLANTVATAVTHHATSVGNGTVARSRRIPIERRAEAAEQA